MTLEQARDAAYAQAVAVGHYALAMRIKRGEADDHPLVVAALAA